VEQPNGQAAALPSKKDFPSEILKSGPKTAQPDGQGAAQPDGQAGGHVVVPPDGQAVVQPDGQTPKQPVPAATKLVGPSVEDNIAELEGRFFVHAYSGDPSEQRLARLEQFVFGKRSSGSAASRLARLKKVLQPLPPVVPIAKPGIPPADAVAPSNSNSASPGGTANVTPDSNQGGGANSTVQTSTSSATAGNASQALSSTPAQIVQPAAKKEPGLIQVMNRGIDNYNSHRYHNAEDDFELTCAMAPGMSRVYTYLAVTKLQVGERQAALDAFNTCYELDPFGSYGRYAKYCLIVLAGDEAIRKRGAVDSTKILDATIGKISEQTNNEIARHNRDGAEISRMRFSVQYANRNAYSDNAVQAKLAQAEAAKRSAYTAESANNLKHLLATKRMPGNANLRAWGTNLTTRYYGSETFNLAPYYIPREYPLQLRAIPQSINSVNTKGKKTRRLGSVKAKLKVGFKSKGVKSRAPAKHVSTSKTKKQHRK